MAEKGKFVGALTILAVLCATILTTVLNVRGVFDSPILLLAMNTIFMFGVSLLVCWVSARSYLVSGSGVLLLVGLGMLPWGIAGLAGGVLSLVYATNVAFTAHNLLVLFSSTLLAAGAVGLVQGPGFIVGGRRKRNIIVTCFFVVFVSILICVASIAGVFPAFWAENASTLVRDLVLWIAITLCVVSFAIYLTYYFASKVEYCYWYSLALGLIAAGVVATALVTGLGTSLRWIGRIGQWAGTVYFLVAVLSARKMAISGGKSLTQTLGGIFTERRHLLAEIESLAKFPSENPNPVVRLNLDKVLYANSSGDQLLKNFKTGVGECPSKLIQDLAKDALSRKEPMDVEQSFDGRTYLLTIVPIAKYVNIYGRDITERKRAEQELRRLNEELEERVQKRTDSLRWSSLYARSLIEASPDPLVTISVEGKITDVNDATVEATGLFRKELLGTDFSSYFTDPEKARSGYLQVFEKGSVTDYPLTLCRKDGRLIDVLYNASVYKDEQGNVLGVFAAARDVTERNRVEKELQRHREHLEALVNEKTAEIRRSEDALRVSQERLVLAQQSAGAGVWDWDIVTGKLDWSVELFRILGLDHTAIEASFDVWMNVIHPEDRQVAEKRIETALADHTPLSSDYRIVLSSGEVRWINALGNASYDAEGEPQRMSGICLDITERKRLEELRDRFVSAVTHELRTPLVSIKGYVDYLLSQDHAKASPEKILRSLTIVREQSNRLMRITDDLLDYRRLSTGTFKLDMKWFDLRNVVDVCIRETQPFLTEKEQTLHMNEPWELIQIYADETRLIQALANLLQNASKFTPEHGQIHLKITRQLDHVELSVTDKGIGIRREDLPRIFEPFAAIEKPTYIKGTGLGLSVSKAIMEAHGGTIRVESDGLEKGATFTLIIPTPESRRSPEQGSAR